MSGIFFSMELVKFGKTLKTHGFRGHIKISHEAFYANDLKKSIKSLFIDQLPYFIQHKDINTPSYAILLLEDIDSKEKAQKLCGKEIYVRVEEIEEVYVEDNYDDLVGYQLQDKKLGDLGEILDIYEMPQQILAQVIYKSKEVLIPLNHDFILAINDKKKIVHIQIPNGLIESQ